MSVMHVGRNTKESSIIVTCVLAHLFIIIVFSYQKNCKSKLPIISSLIFTPSLLLFPSRKKNKTLCLILGVEYVKNILINRIFGFTNARNVYTIPTSVVQHQETSRSCLSLAIQVQIKKNYEDAEHPDLLHLPFPDPSYNLLKHLFLTENGSHTISHQHPLVLEDERCTDITIPATSRKKSVSYHDPIKGIELLCNGCLRPITTTPIYVCTNEDGHCSFVLHKWCSRLPIELKGHLNHPEHILILHSKTGIFSGVFYCDICYLPCNGFVYHCEECQYHIDVTCAFLPTEITHTSHPNHLLSRFYENGYYDDCSICSCSGYDYQFLFSCSICKFHLHPMCALLIPQTTTHKCDKHPMELSYFPIENHKSEYFCEICEEQLNPNLPFYHCRECMQSMHPACAWSIVRYETYTSRDFHNKAIYDFVNVKFGGTYKNIEVHRHPLSFVQGIADDGCCIECGSWLQYKMIFKCLNCEFASHYWCCYRLDYKLLV